jgi:hypothetical protein
MRSTHGSKSESGDHSRQKMVNMKEEMDLQSEAVTRER